MKWSAVKLGLDPKAFTVETLPPCVKKQEDLFTDVLLRTPFGLVAASAALDLLLE